MCLLSAPPLTKLPPISEPLLVIVPLSGTLFSWLIPNPALNLQAHFSWKPSLTPQSGFLCSCFSPSGACCCSVSQLCLILCGPMDYSMPGFPVLYHLPEFAQTNVYWLSDTIQPPHPLSLISLPALNPSQYQGLFQWAGSSHQVAKVLELQLRSFQRIFRVDFFYWFDWFDLSVQGVSRVFSITTFWKHLGLL